MTFDQAKKILDNMTEAQQDEIQVILAKLYKKVNKQNSKAAEAIELASMAIMLYTNGGK